jgi:hypothetical protein
MKSVNVLEVQLHDGCGMHKFGFYLDANNTTKEVENKIQGCMVFEKVLQIFDSIEDREANKPETIRKKALAKLTLLEKQILGLRD